MANPGDFAYTVKQQADIVRVVGEYVQLKKTGAGSFTGLCPFHKEKTPSFHVHETRQFYHCFGCGESGDVLKFVQKIENLTFPEALRLVAQKAGVPLPKASYNSESEAREARLRGALLDMHERACSWFQEQLRRPEAAHAREYASSRGLTEQTLARFRIGYAPDSGFLLRDTLRREYGEELLRESGLFSWKESDSRTASARLGQGDLRKGSFDSAGQNRAGSAQDDKGNAKSSESGELRASLAQDDKGVAALYSKFRNRLMFPICNEAGRVIAFTGRTLSRDEKSGPKYLNSPETAIYSKSRVLFNLDKAKEDIRKAGYAILVEGQMDCISVFAAGIHHVIATSGTAFTEAQVRLLERFTKTLVVNFDPDTAGANAAEKSLAMLVEHDFQIRVVTLEEGYDPDLFLRRKGVEAYAAALRAAPKYFDYLIERAQTRFPRTPDGKAKAVNFLLPHVQRVPSRIVRDEMANEIAQKLGIDPGVLRQELRHAAVARGTVRMKSVPQQAVTPAERIILRALATPFRTKPDGSASDNVLDPARELRPILTAERLHEGLASEPLVEILLRSDGGEVMALELAPEQRSLLAEILMNEQEELTPELLGNTIESLRQGKLRKAYAAAKQGLDEAARAREWTEFARQSKEIEAIEKALGIRRVQTQA